MQFTPFIAPYFVNLIKIVVRWDDVQGCTNVAGGMDAGSDGPCEQPGQGWPVCEPQPKNQSDQHVCASLGGALFGYFLVLFVWTGHMVYKRAMTWFTH